MAADAADRVRSAVDRLLLELQPLHENDSALHQLWLEMQWLSANASDGILILPKDWQLILFRMVDRQPLVNYKTANEAARELKAILPEVAPQDEANW